MIRMMDVAEVLMLEHQSIRHISKYLKIESPQDFDEFHSYLKNVHIVVEENIVFPNVLEKIPDGRKDVKLAVEQIKADHKLIDTLAGNLAKWVQSENTELIKERYPLYFRLLKDHNMNEDHLIFPWWKELELREYRSALKEVVGIIDSFGRERYLHIMEISPDQFEYMFSTV